MMAIIFVAVLLLGCDVAEYPDCPQDNYPVNLQTRIGVGKSILIMGDSRGELGGTWDAMPETVYNAAQGCSTIRGVINRLYLVDALAPDVVAIFTGVNDPAHMDVNEYRVNLSAAICYCVNRGADVYILNPWIPSMSICLLSDSRIRATYLFLDVMKSFSGQYVDLGGFDPIYFNVVYSLLYHGRRLGGFMECKVVHKLLCYYGNKERRECCWTCEVKDCDQQCDSFKAGIKFDDCKEEYY